VELLDLSFLEIKTIFQMKRIYILLFLVMGSSALLQAQSDEGRYYYSTITFRNFLFRTESFVQVRYGADHPQLRWERLMLADPARDGVPIDFENLLEGLNYMVGLGWEFVERSVEVYDCDSTVRYLLRKRFRSDEELYEEVKEYTYVLPR
jgi:hypothetical protein